MIASGHTALGTSLGIIVSSQTQNPLLSLSSALLLGIASHYLADFIPHGHLVRYAYIKNFTGVFADFFGGGIIFLIAIYFYSGISLESVVIVTAITGSLLPDILDGFMMLRVLPKKGLFKLEHRFHQATHWHGRGIHGLPIGWYDLWQLTVILLPLLTMLLIA